MNQVPSPLRRAVTAVVALLAGLLGLAVVAGPAAAHGGAGTLEVLATEPQADGASVKVTVQLSFVADGHPADDATVTVVGEREGVAGADFTPVTLTASGPEGQYTGVVPVPAPGNWTLRVTSVEPPATATTQVSVAGTAGTVGSSSAPSTTATPEPAPATTAPPSSGEDDGGGPSPVLVAAVVGAVAGGVTAYAAGVRRRRAASGGGDDEG